MRKTVNNTVSLIQVSASSNSGSVRDDHYQSATGVSLELIKVSIIRFDKFDKVSGKNSLELIEHSNINKASFSISNDS